MAPRMVDKQTNSKGSSAPDREQRWDEIILASAKIFYEKGYDSTSLQDIATAVGLLKGSIYYYINTKEDLLFELVMRAQAIWKDTINEPDELADAPAPEQLRQFVHRWLRLKETDREWGIVAEREFRRLSPGLLEQVIDGRQEFTTFVQSIIERGMNDGDFDDTLDLALATTMVFVLLKSSHLSRRPRARLSLEALADAYSLFAIRGLGMPDWRPDDD